MGEETLSPEELDALLADAEIISDDTDYTSEESESDESIEVVPAKPLPVAQQEVKKEKAPVIPVEVVDPSNLTPQQKHNAELLLDIYVQITVELGRTNIKVKDVLGLGEGSILELNKPASEPVDLLVNNRLVARGEVVVIDENFGARVTNIVSPMERIESLRL